jgi:TolA-binding protein
MCQIGKAMPDHAREVLTALTFGGIAYPAAPAVGAIRGPGRSGGVELGIANGTLHGEGVVAGTGGGTVAATDKLPVAELAPAERAMDEIRQADMSALAAISQQETRRAAQVAALRDSQLTVQPAQMQQGAQSMERVAQPPVLSEAEIARLATAFDAAYKAMKAIRDAYPTTITAEQARREMLVMIVHWRSLAQWQRAAALAQRFLGDNASDQQLPQLRLQIARDYLSWAAQPIDGSESRQGKLAEVGRRFDEARVQFARIIADLADQKDLLRQAQWDVATSFLAQARTIDGFSPTLARGQYVRAAKELQRVAGQFVDHPNVGTIPQLLWQIAGELASRGYHDEAIIVWNDLVNFDPTNALAQQARPLIGATYQNNLNRPLRAVEAYLEINFGRGGNDTASQNAIFQIGSQLKDQKRWVEAQSVLETFVDSFPRHGSAGQALTTIGQIHQANEAWGEAIGAYRRVISGFPSGNWVQEAKWSIAECTINLSQWREAIAAYEAYVSAYPKDPKVAEASRRIGVLKDLARYQTLVDEAGQRKAFDAQFQIGSIIQTQLANPQKAIIEFRKVAVNWPQSHLADDALFAIGKIYLEMGETDKARASLLVASSQYPDSNLADDALVLVGRSYEDESQKFAAQTRSSTMMDANEKAQKEAYQYVQRQRSDNLSLLNTKIQQLKKSGRNELAELEEAGQAGAKAVWNTANLDVALAKAEQDVQSLSAAQLADRQDKINGALRKAVEAYAAAAKVPGADKAGDALLRMAVIYDEQLKDSAAALATWKEIVNQFSGTSVAEEASWRIAQYHERQANYAEAVEAYKAFLRNYRRSPKAGQAQFSIAEGYEHLNKWVEAMDAYTNYINSFGDGPLAQKAREQINWIKTYRL